jgi:hypothetical protein
VLKGEVERREEEESEMDLSTRKRLETQKLQFKVGQFDAGGPDEYNVPAKFAYLTKAGGS